MLSPSKAIVSALLLVSCALVSLDAHERRFDCSSATPSILAIYKERCSVEKFHDPDIEMNPLKRFDLIEECSCELLRHTLVWEALLNHEIETLYLVAKKLVKGSEDEKDKDKEVAKVAMTDAIYRDDLDGRMYFWDRFAAIMKGADSEDKRSELGETMLEGYAEIYYRPDSHTKPYADLGITAELGNELKRVCSGLADNFAEFVKYFGNLRSFSGNPRFVYKLAAYDDNLYKLMNVYKMCLFLKTSGTII